MKTSCNHGYASLSYDEVQARSYGSKYRCRVCVYDFNVGNFDAREVCYTEHRKHLPTAIRFDQRFKGESATEEVNVSEFQYISLRDRKYLKEARFTVYYEIPPGFVGVFKVER